MLIENIKEQMKKNSSETTQVIVMRADDNTTPYYQSNILKKTFLNQTEAYLTISNTSNQTSLNKSR